MSLLDLAISGAVFAAAVAFVVWVAYTCGYDRGWADKEDGKPHRDDRLDRVAMGEAGSDE